MEDNINLVTSSLGPISDLEKHLPTDWWASLFNSIYLKTDGDVVENEVNTNNEVDLIINATNIKKDNNILDLCCGQGRHSIELYNRGYSNVEGIDRSAYLISVAKSRAREHNQNIKFSEGDARNIDITHNSKDCVIIMGNSFGYFEREEDDNAILSGVYNILKPGGKLLLDIVDGEWISKNFSKRSWEWIDNEFFVNRERTLSKDKKRLITREVVTNTKHGVIADQFYAERLYSFEEISNNLKAIGFENIENYTRIDTHSTRSQDLGMMEHRYIIIAEAGHKQDNQKEQFKAQQITVLLGDPRCPDKIKVNNKFNKEDYETIDKLKNALNEIKDYQFVYHDYHEHLIDDLIKNKPNFIMNLCDEGYKNEATLELHIPALLEILGIKYTGSSPQCLAICYDKSKVRAIAKEFNIPVPEEFYFSSDDYSTLVPKCLPALVKPALGDSSYGITKKAKVNSAEELVEYIGYLNESIPNVPILVQEFLSGTEYSVGLIGNYPNIYVMPVLEVDYSELPDGLPKILSYESKWLPESEYWNKIKYKKANLTPKQYEKLSHYSKEIFKLLDCRDYARVDFRADKDGKIKLLEVNPNPGWCWDGKMNIMAEFDGMSYNQMLQKILEAAISRYNLQ